MNGQIRLLIIEDSEYDALLIIKQLEKQNFSLQWKRIDTESEMVESLANECPDIIIADYALPNFSATRALEILKISKKDIPFIIVSGSIGEREAVKIMRNGANDYIMKDNLARLGPAINRELDESVLRKERIRFYDELQNKQAYLEGIIESAMDAIISVDSKFCITLFNPAAEKMFKVKATDITGKHISDIFPESVKDKQFNLLFRNIGENKIYNTSLSESLKGIRSDSEIFPIEISLSEQIIFNEIHYVLIIRDISDKRKLESQFLRAQRLESIGTLAGGIAHDLNNVLAPVLMGFQVIRNDLQSDRAKRMLNTMEYSIKRGAEIVKQILTFARGIEGEKMELHPKQFLKEIIDFSFETFSKSIEIRFNVPQNLWTIIGDLTQLHQIFLNLCVNARDAMPNGGTLIINAENIELKPEDYSKHTDIKSKNFVLISVSDTGTGIPEEMINKIFDPFFTTKDPSKGTGLGLATVQAIVRHHGGFIDIESKMGKGSTFKIYLPAIAQNHFQDNEYAKKDIPGGQGEVILVIDDEYAIREMTKTALVSYGYEVITANDGIEGVAIFQKQVDRIKVVITDLIMPIMDGHATVKSLLRTNPNVKILIVSGYSEQEQIEQELTKGNIRFLAKPYTASELLSKLNEIIIK